MSTAVLPPKTTRVFPDSKRLDCSVKGMKELMSSRVVAKAEEPAEIVVGDWNNSTYAEILTW